MDFEALGARQAAGNPSKAPGTRRWWGTAGTKRQADAAKALLRLMDTHEILQYGQGPDGLQAHEAGRGKRGGRPAPAGNAGKLPGQAQGQRAAPSIAMKSSGTARCKRPCASFAGGNRPDRAGYPGLSRSACSWTATPASFPGGQQQQVAIARTLAPGPKVLFMDEPLSNLDAKLRLEMRSEPAAAAPEHRQHLPVCDPRPDGGHDPGH